MTIALADGGGSTRRMALSAAARRRPRSNPTTGNQPTARAKSSSAAPSPTGDGKRVRNWRATRRERR
jgi:hypothetical protein